MLNTLERECIKIDNIHTLDLDITLDCGQCFRWEKEDDGRWHGIAFGKELWVKCENGTLELYNTSREDVNNIWREYFDLVTDYEAICNSFSCNEILNKAAKYAPGIHILSQEPWEALCSFIISQNNNIPRIKGIISRLCENFGKKLPLGGYNFPSADILAPLSEKDLAPLRCGFRAKYILDAARKVSSGEIDLNKLRILPVDQAREILKTIKGVGPKVAECTLLYGLHRLECFPMDVWMKRAMSELLPEGLPISLNAHAGIAQQYLFHYTRMNYSQMIKK